MKKLLTKERSEKCWNEEEPECLTNERSKERKKERKKKKEKERNIEKDMKKKERKYENWKMKKRGGKDKREIKLGKKRRKE